MSTPGPRSPASAIAVVGVVGVVALVTLGALWAASLGPDAAIRGGGSVRGSATPTEQTCQPAPPSGEAAAPPREAAADLPECEAGAVEPGGQRDSEQAHPVILILAAVILAGVAALLLVALFWAARRARRTVAAALSPLQLEELDDGMPDDPLPAATENALPEAERLLTSGTPRNAVVACWDRLESIATEVGLSREPWETSEEFGRHQLVAAGATPSAAEELAGLFREARYSTHELTEDHRLRAINALSVIAQDLVAARQQSARKE